MKLKLQLLPLLFSLPTTLFSAAGKPIEGYRMARQAISAVQRNNPEALYALIENGAPINQADKRGESLLIHACQGVNPNMVHYLLAKRADATAVSIEGKTALIYALQNPALAGAPSVVRALKRAEAANGQDNLSKNCARFLGSARLQKEISEIPVLTKRKQSSSSEEEELLPSPLPALAQARLAEKRKVPAEECWQRFDAAKEARVSCQPAEVESLTSAVDSLRIAKFTDTLSLSAGEKVLCPSAKKP